MKKTYTETEETLSDWERALSENDYKKLLNSKLSFIQCFSIDQVQREEGLPEQAWDKETYDELFDAHANSK